MATVRVPVQWHAPRQTSLAGNSFWTILARTNYDHGIWQFVTSVDGVLMGRVLVPEAIAGTPAAKLQIVIQANATSGVTRLSAGVAFAAKDAADPDASVSMEASQDITVPGTAYLRKLVTFPASGSLTDTPAAGEIGIVRLFHEGAHANDTLVPNTILEGGWLLIDV